MTKIEETFLDDLHRDAESLENGKAGDVQVLSSVIGRTARVVVAMARTGGVGLMECQSYREAIVNQTAEKIKNEVGSIKHVDPLAVLAAVIPICVTVFGGFVAWVVFLRG